MSRTVLQIDDEPSISTALKIRLNAAGFEVVSATDGRSGLEAARLHQPDVILLDIRMPEMDGFEVCRRLKSDTTLADVPVVFLSANVKDEAREQGREVGGSAFVSKPYNARDLLRTIQAVLTSDITPEA